MRNLFWIVKHWMGFGFKIRIIERLECELPKRREYVRVGPTVGYFLFATKSKMVFWAYDTYELNAKRSR